jgi:hypothetical protein
MNLDFFAFIALAVAGSSAAMFTVNQFFYCRIKSRHSGEIDALSVLIPARNEELNIHETLKAVLANQDCNFEVIVLDDHSTDRTALIVEEFAAVDRRVRIEKALPLPAGWCGKQYACYQLAGFASHPLLLFIDADVRLAPGALSKMAVFMKSHSCALASGIPMQELGTFSERLLLPLIHFILLCYLPMPVMRWTKRAGFSAGCGQLFIARREAYIQCGGHARLRESLHDGLKLPRVFRRAGYCTGLFDATDLATCRMYRSNLETLRGLGKNAVEGIAAKGTISLMTLVLFGGQILPFILLAALAALSQAAVKCAAAAAIFAIAPRIICAWRFRQPIASAVLHPVGIIVLLAIQWHARFRHILGKPVNWKGRYYGPAKA